MKRRPPRIRKHLDYRSGLALGLYNFVWVVLQSCSCVHAPVNQPVCVSAGLSVVRMHLGV